MYTNQMTLFVGILDTGGVIVDKLKKCHMPTTLIMLSAYGQLK